MKVRKTFGFKSIFLINQADSHNNTVKNRLSFTGKIVSEFKSLTTEDDIFFLQLPKNYTLGNDQSLRSLCSVLCIF